MRARGHCISRLQRTGAVKRCAESSLANRRGQEGCPDNLIGIEGPVDGTSASVLHEPRAGRQAAGRLRARRALALARPLRAPRSAFHRSSANLATPSPS